MYCCGAEIAVVLGVFGVYCFLKIYVSCVRWHELPHSPSLWAAYRCISYWSLWQNFWKKQLEGGKMVLYISSGSLGSSMVVEMCGRTCSYNCSQEAESPAGREQWYYALRDLSPVTYFLQLGSTPKVPTVSSYSPTGWETSTEHMIVQGRHFIFNHPIRNKSCM